MTTVMDYIHIGNSTTRLLPLLLLLAYTRPDKSNAVI